MGIMPGGPGGGGGCHPPLPEGGGGGGGRKPAPEPGGGGGIPGGGGGMGGLGGAPWAPGGGGGIGGGGAPMEGRPGMCCNQTESWNELLSPVTQRKMVGQFFPKEPSWSWINPNRLPLTLKWLIFTAICHPVIQDSVVFDTTSLQPK